MTSTVTIRRLNDAFHFEIANAEGLTVHTDASAALGGESKGVRPMELLLGALGTCSGIDVVDILRKKRLPVRHFEATVSGEREAGAIPAVYVRLTIVYKLYGEIPREAAEQAVALSLRKYCSVAAMLEKTAPIHYEIEIHP